MSGLRGLAGFLECWAGPEELGADPLQHDSHTTYRFSLGARLGVHAFRGRGDRRNRFVVIEDVSHVWIGGSETLHKAGRVGRRCLTGREWRWRQWRSVYRIEQRKEAARHWEGGFLSAY